MNHKEAKDFLINSLIKYYEPNELKALAGLVFLDIFNLTENEFKKQQQASFTETKKLENTIERLKKYEPLQYIAGFTYFNGLKIMVDENVLIPRPETEELVNWVMADNPIKQSVIADICTGSGCIALALKQHFSLSKIIATDISEKALTIALSNEKSLFDKQTINFINHDCLTEKWEEMMPVIVVSNPPYIAQSEEIKMDENVLNWEPHIALFAPENDVLIFYKSIIQLFLNKQKTIFYFEINPLFTSELKEYCNSVGLQCNFRQDMFGKVRFAKIF